VKAVTRFNVIFLSIFAVGFSIGGVKESPSDLLLKILNAHQKKIPVKKRFTQTKSIKEMDLKLESEGQLEVKSPGHATWTILKPAYLSVEVSPEEIKIFNDAKGTPRVIKKNNSASSEMEGGDWLKILMEKPEKILDSFDVTLSGADRYHLISKKKNQGFDFVELVFTKTSDLREVKIQENADDSLTIHFKET
jgi:hypothetical protein